MLSVGILPFRGLYPYIEYAVAKAYSKTNRGLLQNPTRLIHFHSPVSGFPESSLFQLPRPSSTGDPVVGKSCVEVLAIGALLKAIMLLIGLLSIYEGLVALIIWLQLICYNSTLASSESLN